MSMYGVKSEGGLALVGILLLLNMISSKLYGAHNASIIDDHLFFLEYTHKIKQVIHILSPFEYASFIDPRISS